MIKNNKDWRFAGVFYDVESGLHRKLFRPSSSVSGLSFFIIPNAIRADIYFAHLLLSRPFFVAISYCFVASLAMAAIISL